MQYHFILQYDCKEHNILMKFKLLSVACILADKSNKRKMFYEVM